MNQSNTIGVDDNKDIQLLRKKIIWLMLIIFFVLMLLTVTWSWYKMAFPQQKILVSCNKMSPEIMVSVRYPKYLAVGDLGEIWVTVTNLQSASISPVKVSDDIVVYFLDTSRVVFDPESSNVILLKNIKPGEVRTQVIKFYLNEETNLFYRTNTFVKFGIKLSKDSKFCDDKFAQINISPIHMLQTVIIPFLGKFGLGAIFIAVIGLVWDNIKAFLSAS